MTAPFEQSENLVIQDPHSGTMSAQTLEDSLMQEDASDLCADRNYASYVIDRDSKSP